MTSALLLIDAGLRFLARHARRLVVLLVLAALIYGFAQTLPFDAAFWMGGEALTYLDVALGVALTTAGLCWRPLLRQSRDVVASWGRRATREARRAVRRLTARSDDDGRSWHPA